jgi:hypothetical protein
MSKQAPATADYEVTRAREINGVWRKIGERVPLTEAQAKYYLPPMGSGLKPVAAKPEKPKPAAKTDAPAS